MNINRVVPTKIEGLIRKYNLNPFKVSHASYLNLMLLFGGLKWCDHLGSAMITDLKMLTDENFLFLQKQKAGLNAKGLDFYAHQKQCAEVNGNLLLTAPTGSGKTESAFLWLQNQLKHSGQARVFYILPFTASINAMYKRLNEAIGDDKVGMLHGKLSDFFNNYFDDLQYDVRSKKDSIASIRDKFKSVVTPIKVVTPFQLLKHLFALKGYEQGFFEMAGSYLMFDEIHAYSPEVFAQIKVLLEFATKYLQVKVLIMTATMPRFMQKELEDCIQPFTTVTADTTLYNQFKRHRIVLRAGLLQNALDEIAVQLQEGKKVLVVCNTVRSAQHVFTHLKDLIDDDKALLLHGSFTGADRSSKEKDLMTKEISLLVGTQAIEVSLDIDYDIIYTEPAPVDALIQRFGRVNRRRKKGICNCYVFTENNKSDGFIYNLKVIEKTVNALQKVSIKDEGIIDESGLQSLIDEVYEDWDADDKKTFDSQYQYLKDAIDVLSPMFKNKHTEEDFYKQFDGIKILPQSKKSVYEDKLQNFDFISAESQKVQIRKGRFAQWLQSSNLKQDISVFASKNKMLEQRFWLTNKKYTTELGLITDEEEPWNTAEIW
jgi:CRISPR-associated endonuclease/helicase Cas3